MNSITTQEHTDVTKEKTKGAVIPNVSQSTPAVTEENRLHTPSIIWYPPRIDAFLDAGASSDTKVFCTGSNAPQCNPYTTNKRGISYGPKKMNPLHMTPNNPKAHTMIAVLFMMSASFPKG